MAIFAISSFQTREYPKGWKDPKSAHKLKADSSSTKQLVLTKKKANNQCNALKACIFRANLLALGAPASPGSRVGSSRCMGSRSQPSPTSSTPRARINIGLRPTSARYDSRSKPWGSLLPPLFPGVCTGDLGMSIAKNWRGAEPCAEHPEILTPKSSLTHSLAMPPGNFVTPVLSAPTHCPCIYLTILIPAIFTSVASQLPLGQPPCGVSSQFRGLSGSAQLIFPPPRPGLRFHNLPLVKNNLSCRCTTQARRQGSARGATSALSCGAGRNAFPRKQGKRARSCQYFGKLAEKKLRGVCHQALLSLRVNKKH